MKNAIPLLVIIMFTCKNQNSISNNQNKLENLLKEIELVDTFTKTLQLERADRLIVANYHPLYIGPKKDSILLSYSSSMVKNRTIGQGSYRIPRKGDLKIYVNSSKVIGSGSNQILNKDQEVITDWKYVNSRGETSSHPIIVENKSRDTLNIGYGEHIPMTLEALDSLSKWRPIQQHYTYSCGTGLPNFYLPPGELLITYCQQYDGDFKTKLRVVFGFGTTNYSNEFDGKIDYKQFECINEDEEKGN